MPHHRFPPQRKPWRPRQTTPRLRLLALWIGLGLHPAAATESAAEDLAGSREEIVLTAPVLHEKFRSRPYPRAEHRLLVNPPPLLLPADRQEGERFEFQLSRDPAFPSAGTISSEPRPWKMFRAPEPLAPGPWHWRHRRIAADAAAQPWSEPEHFTVEATTARYCPPPPSTFLAGIPTDHPRTHPLLRRLAAAADPERVRAHPEFRPLEGRLRPALDFAQAVAGAADGPGLIGEANRQLNFLIKGWIVTDRPDLLDAAAAIAARLDRLDDETIRRHGDFTRAAWAESVALALDFAADRLEPELHRRLRQRLTLLLDSEFAHHLGRQEAHIFDNHFWQHCLRQLVNANLVLFDPADEASGLRLAYYYELWASRGPATGFNAGGDSFYGTAYFNAEADTLFLLPATLGQYSGFDFYSHPWFRAAGRALFCTWPPNSLSDGFGDGHENTPVPFRARVALADYLGREHGVPLAAWYASACNAGGSGMHNDILLREYRILRSEDRPEVAAAPDLPSGAAFPDTGAACFFNDPQPGPDQLYLTFRSCPFGSGSHTHSHQNAFNLHHRGQAIFRAAGHYFNFADAHNLMSYRHSRAADTILVDGIGQSFTAQAYGWLARFSNSDHIGYCLGDASRAYRGPSADPMWLDNLQRAGIEQTAENGFGATPLTRFRRHLILLRPATVVIYDELEARQPARFDWLLHSPLEMQLDGDRQLGVRAADGTLQARVIQFGSSPLQRGISTGHLVPPDIGIARRRPTEPLPEVWNFTASTEPATGARWLTVITLPVADAAPATVTGDAAGLQVMDWTIRANLDPASPPALRIEHRHHAASLSYGAPALAPSRATTIDDTDQGRPYHARLADQPPRTSA